MPLEQTSRIKILYAIQGTGNGHLARATALIPELRKYADVEVLLSGIQVDLQLPFEVKYRFKGLSFIFGKHGGIDVWRMMLRVNFLILVKEIYKLKLDEYDLVLNDYEPVSAWASKRLKVPCIQFSHQAAVMQPEAPEPEHQDPMGKWILKHYAPADHYFGFHFQRYNNRIFTPIIRDEVREVKPSKGKHITVYLPAYTDAAMCKFFHQFPDEEFRIFSKHTKKSYCDKNCLVAPVQNEAFIQSIADSDGVICGAGFETPAEVMFLRKKLLVVPMSHQYEQYCNAYAAEKMGVTVMKHVGKSSYEKVKDWLENAKPVGVDYPDNKTESIMAVLEYANATFFKDRFQFSFLEAKHPL